MIVHKYYIISVEVWQYKISRKVEFMDYNEIDWFGLSSMVTNWMRYAGAKARKDFMDEVRKTDYDMRAVVENDLEKGYVFNFAVDHSDELYEVGQFLVYLFVDSNGDIYYVGMGNETRIMDKKNRNQNFLKRYQSCDSKIVILSKWSTRKIALEVEKMAIWKCQMDGYNLTNEKDMLSPKGIYELRHLSEDFNDDTALQREYRNLIERHKKELTVLDEIEKWLYNDGASKNPGYVNEKSDAIYTVGCWTIDGVTKTRSQWCREYNINTSKAYKRIEIGCTPKEALTFPTAPREEKRNIVQWWAKNGYFPGTDKTSYVTPYEEWPKNCKPHMSIRKIPTPPDMVSDC